MDLSSGQVVYSFKTAGPKFCFAKSVVVSLLESAFTSYPNSLFKAGILEFAAFLKSKLAFLMQHALLARIPKTNYSFKTEKNFG